MNAEISLHNFKIFFCFVFLAAESKHKKSVMNLMQSLHNFNIGFENRLNSPVITQNTDILHFSHFSLSAVRM